MTCLLYHYPQSNIRYQLNLLNNYVDYLPVSSQKVPVYPWKITSYDATPKSTFIFGNDNTEPIITDSRQITTLANVVANPDGLKALRVLLDGGSK